MIFSMIATLGLTVALVFAASDTPAQEKQRAFHARLAQASQKAAGDATANNLQGIGLTDSHKRIIYDRIAREQGQPLSSDPRLSVGDTVPESVILNAMPIAVKDQVGLLRDYKFVKLQDDNILIVDPASRKIMDIISKQDAGR